MRRGAVPRGRAQLMSSVGAGEWWHMLGGSDPTSFNEGNALPTIQEAGDVVDAWKWFEWDWIDLHDLQREPNQTESTLNGMDWDQCPWPFRQVMPLQSTLWGCPPTAGLESPVHLLVRSTSGGWGFGRCILLSPQGQSAVCPPWDGRTAGPYTYLR